MVNKQRNKQYSIACCRGQSRDIWASGEVPETGQHLTLGVHSAVQHRAPELRVLVPQQPHDQLRWGPWSECDHGSSRQD
jgi:hypothetical protein